MKARGTTDGVESPGVFHRHHELRYDEAIGRLNQMLAKRPPTEIVNLFKIPVGAFEKRDIPLEPFKGMQVANKVGGILKLHRVEVFDVMTESLRLEHQIIVLVG